MANNKRRMLTTADVEIKAAYGHAQKALEHAKTIAPYLTDPEDRKDNEAKIQYLEVLLRGFEEILP